ncbi:MAG: amidohydrolase [Lentisphaerae bacterium]|nr:amidohydrolase [Lentisphaerota bacterium]OQC12478.1 MAG: p-aminobenzoyl-glutamate hydrolase subunit B [Lentisphaerae bacterium ADurb.Bin082]HQL88588.1 amidohydrolase [Lentisphaeria bacterium]
MKKIDAVKAAVIKAIDARKDDILALGDYFWKNPEAGYREYKTAAKATETLRSLGMAVREKLAVTGMRADLDGAKPGPTVAILGELDALLLPTHPECDPETGAVHACGHHAHVTAMLGAAMGLVDSGAMKSLSGRVSFIGTPAEECIEFEHRLQMMAEGKIQALGGKSELIRVGAFDDVDIAIMHHAGVRGYGVSDHNGFVMKTVRFKGKSCHAAGPGGGVNAFHAATLAVNALGMIRETFSRNRTIRVHGIMTSGGDVVNIIPDSCKMEYMLRADNMEEVKVVSRQFDNVMAGAATAVGTDVEIRTVCGYMPLKDDDALLELFKEAVKLIEPDWDKPVGRGFSMGSTDMGDVGCIMPVIHGSAPGMKGTGHGIDFTVDDPVRLYLNNAKLAALMVVDLLHGKAEKGREIADRREGKMTVQEYIDYADSFTSTQNVADVLETVIHPKTESETK